MQAWLGPKHVQQFQHDLKQRNYEKT